MVAFKGERCSKFLWRRENLIWGYLAFYWGLESPLETIISISIICISDASCDLDNTKQEIIYHELEQNRIAERYNFIVCIFENFSQQVPVTI